MSESQTTPTFDDEIDLRKMFRTLWAGRLLIALFVILGAAVGIAYALLSPKIYRAEASVQIRDEGGSGLASELGGLAALAGISVGGQDKNRELALAALKSRAVIQLMIEEENLLPILYARHWDAKNQQWKTSSPPTPWKAYEYFTRRVLKVTEDKKSGILTIAVEWRDPALTVAWVNSLILRVNTFVNAATVREAEQNLKFLDQQTKTATVVELQKTIFSMMEGEIKRLMIARNPETAPLRVIDPPVLPERNVRPKRIMAGILGILGGALLGGLIVIARSAFRG